MGQNYVGLTHVRDVLIAAGLWLTGGGVTHSPTSSYASRQPELVNYALQHAATLPWPIVLSSKSFTPVFDIGYADYATLAFRVFGLRIQALYYLYFVALSLSGAILCATFFAHPAALWTLCIMLLTLRWSKLYLTIFDTWELNYVYAHHFLSTLAIIPAFYLMLATLTSQPPGLLALLACLVQSYLIHVSWRIRYAASWVLLAIIAATATSLILNLQQAPRLLDALINFVREGETTDGATAAISALIDLPAYFAGLWPGLTLLLTFAICSWRYRHRLSPVFKTDEIMDSYPRWHAAYLGLAMDPQSWQRNKRRGQSDYLEDLNSVYGAKYWLLSTPGAGARFGALRPELADFHLHKFDMKWRIYDHIIRETFLDYFRKNLAAMPRLYLIRKPRALLRAVTTALLPVLRGLKDDHPFESVLLGLIVSIFAMLSFRYDDGSLAVVGALAWLTLAAPAPQIWAYTTMHGIGDQAWVAFFGPWALALAAVVGVAALLAI
ncbi:MAG: hypothetical protein HYR63_25090 [Proteobacteria bacterium]|nr:hypothetical protein [Pseudomonadota bacterium]